MCISFFKQTPAYEMRISGWSSDVCSSDLDRGAQPLLLRLPDHLVHLAAAAGEIILLAGRDLIAPVLLTRPPDMPFDRKPHAALFAHHDRAVGLLRRRVRSEEGRVGNEFVSTCRIRGSPFH